MPKKTIQKSRVYIAAGAVACISPHSCKNHPAAFFGGKQGGANENCVDPKLPFLLCGRTPPFFDERRHKTQGRKK